MPGLTEEVCSKFDTSEFSNKIQEWNILQNFRQQQKSEQKNGSDLFTSSRKKTKWSPHSLDNQKQLPKSIVVPRDAFIGLDDGADGIVLKQTSSTTERIAPKPGLQNDSTG